MMGKAPLQGRMELVLQHCILTATFGTHGMRQSAWKTAFHVHSSSRQKKLLALPQRQDEQRVWRASWLVLLHQVHLWTYPYRACRMHFLALQCCMGAAVCWLLRSVVHSS